MVDTSSGNGWSPIPMPVLAVVERLPGNVDMIASIYQYEQIGAESYPFNLYFHAEDYAKDLHYFVPATVDYEEFSNDVNTLAKELTDVELDITNEFLYAPEIEPFKDGDFVTISADDVDYNIWKAINDEVLSIYGAKDVHRVFEYDFGRSTLPTTGFISIHFQDLDMLSEFEKYISSEYDVKIEMSQINAKQNFNAVSAMGNILSWAIIAFAIIAIILFIVNLLQSYFQKVKRNLGTFKAFGISNRDLISVYVLILGAIILAAVVLSVSVTWFIQGGLHICGILKDGMFDYLSLWSVKTVCSIAIIVVASVYTVGAVMHKLLKATPGDLIYDRQ
jgi:ABC-type antimicrobial peptide transport system permease subunit